MANTGKEPLGYKRRPRPTKTYPDFDERVARFEDEMWWDAARGLVGRLDHSVCPAAWTFVAKTSDFWTWRKKRERNPVAAYVTGCSDLIEILSCGFYDELFGYFDLGRSEYARIHPVKAREKMFSRRSDVEGDLFEIWGALTSGMDRALPLSRCEDSDDVACMLRRASRELGVRRYVRAYARGKVTADEIRRCTERGIDIDKFAEMKRIGVPEEDIFA